MKGRFMKIAIIGAGNMGGAIALGLVKSKFCAPQEIWCTAKHSLTLERLQELCPEFHTSMSNLEACELADVIILAVKPWILESVIDELRPCVDFQRQLLVSVAAGVALSDLKHYFMPYVASDGAPEPVIFRVVPNTAVAILEGVTLMAHARASTEQVASIQQLFSALGYCAVVDESLIPAGTSLTSCGIAFALRYLRAAMEGGVELGFRPEEATRMVAHTMRGAASLLLENGVHPEVEIDKVTTAGGITIKGLNAMEKAGFTAAVIEGLKVSKS
jgi:pyrroline-5-carboxylate reductase